jgi:gliding motility-associated-like protein
MKLDAGNGYASYMWQNGSDNEMMDVVDSGTYWVRLMDKNGCTYTDSVKVGSVEPLPMSFLPADTVICSGETFDIKPLQSFQAYRWSTGETGNSLKIKDPGEYTLQVVDSFGCTGSDTIKIETKTCPSGIFFSNAFTPNKDGHNDTFTPVMFITPITYHLIIYNRWGQLVFESNNPVTGWDGRMGGVEQESGTYIWVCTYQFAGKKKNVMNGIVLLLR